MATALRKNVPFLSLAAPTILPALHHGIGSGELRTDLDAADLARGLIALQNGAIHLWLADPAAFSLKPIRPPRATPG